MSHSVPITIIVDGEIRLCGEEVNVHDLESIVLDSDGRVVEFRLFKKCGTCKGWGIYAWPDGSMEPIGNQREARQSIFMLGTPWRECPECGCSPYQGRDGKPATDAVSRGL